MSLHMDINELTNMLQKNNKNIIDKIETKEEKEQKVYIKKAQILDDLKEEIKISLKYERDLFDTETKTEIIDNMLDYTPKLNNIKYTKAFIISNYDAVAQKLLQEHRKRQKEDEKEQKALYQEQLKREREEAIARQEAYNTIITSLKYILLIVSSPFILLFAFVFGMLKSVK